MVTITAPPDNIKLIENVEIRATKLDDGLRDLEYSERLKKTPAANPAAPSTSL